MQAVLIVSHKNWWDSEAKTSEHLIEADTPDGIYAIAFREFFNRYKYCNGTRIRFRDPIHAASYEAWISDVRNYANNGGDMW